MLSNAGGKLINLLSTIRAFSPCMPLLQRCVVLITLQPPWLCFACRPDLGPSTTAVPIQGSDKEPKREGAKGEALRRRTEGNEARSFAGLFMLLSTRNLIFACLHVLASHFLFWYVHTIRQFGPRNANTPPFRRVW